MLVQRTARGVAAATVALVLSACAATTVEVSPQAPPSPTTADFYGSYELVLPDAESGAPAGEMIGTWSDTGLTVELMGDVIIQTQIELATEPGIMLIWDDNDSDPSCAAEGQYGYEDDGTTITLTLISDQCEGRNSSANGAQLIRLE